MLPRTRAGTRLASRYKTLAVAVAPSPFIRQSGIRFYHIFYYLVKAPLLFVKTMLENPQTDFRVTRHQSVVI